MAEPKPAQSAHVEDALVDACLSALRALSPSVVAEFLPCRVPSQVDGELRIRIRQHEKPERFKVRTTRTHLSYALVSGFIGQTRNTGGNWVLFAPYVPGRIGSHLASHNVSYVDVVGNCHLHLANSNQLLAHVEGKKPRRDPIGRTGGRVPSHQLLFAILAQPALLDKPVREIAIAAGIGKTAVADQLKRLTERGFVQRGRSRSALVRSRDLLDRWLTAYADVVRPTWLLGRYRTQATDPVSLEKQIQDACGERAWALGGGAAAWQMTHFYRGTDTVLHLTEARAELPRHLRAIPARDGGLTILRTPGTIAYAGTSSHLAHPLLVYSEMVASDDPRMTEAADGVRKRFLKELG